jgi:hypothetical protein
VKLATRNQYIRFLKISLWIIINKICLIWNKNPKNTVY